MNDSRKRSSSFSNIIVSIIVCVILFYVNFAIYRLYQGGFGEDKQTVAILPEEERYLQLAGMVERLVREHYVDKKLVATPSMMDILWKKLEKTQLVHARKIGDSYLLLGVGRRLQLQDASDFGRTLTDVSSWLAGSKRFADAYAWDKERRQPQVCAECGAHWS